MQPRDRQWSLPTETNRLPFVVPDSSEATAVDLVRVWIFPYLCPPTKLPELSARLTHEERQRAAGIRHPQTAERFIVSRSWLREILAAHIGCAPHQVPITYDRGGKPVLPPSVGWHFNVSHSGEYVLIGLTRTGEIGVDIEQIRDGFQVEPIARRFFSEIETQDLMQLRDRERLIAFFRCWTRKEAFIKAIGSGLSYPLNEFDVTLLPRDPPAIRRVRGDAVQAGNWTLHDVPTPDGYVGALAVHASGKSCHIVTNHEFRV